ncbi:IS110 family RNA-guided transposase [Pontibacter pamirensis]|uniref:IS110 family transposase n=1 Tax=Pontibacter pamirensis TaxID=2562824 RepID=UPI001389A1FC|nr:IS110 family transposase [Pontibacter pamirensis]
MEQAYIGIDVAKDSFVAATRVEGNLTTSLHNNDRKGISDLLKGLPDSCWCIMEATGVYSLQLAMALYEKGIKVSVVNPLQIKRFAQTKLKRTKTDKVDTALIAEYGERMQPKLYEPPAPFMRKLQQQRMSLKLLVKSKRSFLNQLHALTQLDKADKAAVKACKTVLASIEKQIVDLERQMQQTAEENCQELFTFLQTIPCISKKSAIELLVVSGGFRSFTSARQFSAFIGISPCINESGTSIRGYRGISRIGDKNIRATLYMCAMAAKVYNKACRELYERMVTAGKAKKVALVAVMNKLIKQVFGKVRSGEVYSAECQAQQLKK